MPPVNILPHWVQAMVAAVGGAGLFVISFLDSSVATFPIINDFLVVELSIRNPARMAYYALMATLGSVIGCVFLYFLARKGGEAFFRRRAGGRAERIRRWTQQNGFLSMLVTALLPPPTPFKVFVLAAAVFGVPLRSFTLALLVARAVRYFAIGFLAIRYGNAAANYLVAHKLLTSGVTLAVVLLIYGLLRLLFRAEEAIE